MSTKGSIVKQISAFLHALYTNLGSARAFYFIFTLSFAVRLVVLILLLDKPICDDGAEYQLCGMEIVRGTDIPLYWPPGLPYYLALFYKIFSCSEIVSRLAMIPVYLVLTGSIFMLAKELAGIRIGNVSMLIFSLYPTFVHLSNEPLTQIPAATFLVIAALGCLKLTRHGPWPWSVVLGLTLGALILTRPSSIILAVAIPIFLLLRTRSIVRALIPLILASVMLGGWLFYIQDHTGHFVWINYANSKNVFKGNNQYTPLYKTWWFGSHYGSDSLSPEFNSLLIDISSQPREKQDGLFKEVALTHIKARPDLFILRTLNRIRCFFAFDTLTGSFLMKWYNLPKPVGLLTIFVDAIFYSALILLAMVGLLLYRLDHHRSIWDAALLLGIGVVYSGPYWISFSHPVYHFPIMPLIGVFAAYCIGQLFENRPVALTAIRNHRIYLISLTLIFVYIQIEWVWMLRDRL